MKKTFLFLSLVLIAMTVGGCSLFGNKTTQLTAPQAINDQNFNDAAPVPAPAPIIDQTVASANGQPSPTNVQPSPTNVQPKAVSAQKFAVDIKNFTFSPPTVIVRVGDTINWTNNDSVPHQIQGGPVNSPVFSRGGSFSFTFTEAGTFNYICSLHPAMKGKIIVQ